VTAPSPGKRSAANYLELGSYRCGGHVREGDAWRRCDYVFIAGDVVYRYRRGNPSWRLVAVCERCRPCWVHHWQQARPCWGGCGVLVSSPWNYRRPPVVCSRRCARRVRAACGAVVERAPVICDVCGEEFEPARSDARYCSNRCRQDAHRKRKLLGGVPAS
jgi:hypothetical protein